MIAKKDPVTFWIKVGILNTHCIVYYVPVYKQRKYLLFYSNYGLESF